MIQLLSMVKPRSETLLLLILAVAVGGLWFWRQAPRPAKINQLTEASPSPVPDLTGQSPDGKISLTLKQQPGAAAITWTLTASQDGAAAERIWWQTLPADTALSLPPNSVSPDNQYLFLQLSGADSHRYLVLTATGLPLGKETQTVEFAEAFSAQYPEFKITAVTGWGGVNLIVFNTDKISGGIGPSFWFDVPSRSFIRLSNRFN